MLDRFGDCSFPPSNLIGYEDDKWYCLYADQAHKEVKKLCDEQGELFSCSKQSLLKSLAEEGLIETADGRIFSFVIPDRDGVLKFLKEKGWRVT